MNNNLKKAIPHLVAVIIFLLVSYIYFFPAVEGKVLQGGDNITAKSMQGEVRPYSALTGDYCGWTNGSFGGMPVFTIGGFNRDLPLRMVTKVINFFTSGEPINYLFIAMFAFYILLISYGINPWLSIAGSLAYTFSSYFIIIIGAGHITKALGLAYMPGVIAGLYLVYKQNKVFLGASLMALFLAMEIGPGHYQIIYYTILIVVAIGIHFLILAVKNKTLPSFFMNTGILIVAALLAGLANTSTIWPTQEYTPFSARGQSILSAGENANSVSADGLDFEYATQWSYGVSESLNLLIPNFRGGSSAGALTENSEIYKLYSQGNSAQAKQIIKQLPLYWGPQPSTEGPAYLGAIMLFLYVFGLFYLKSKEKWWILIISVFALLLAWGNHFEAFNRFIFNYFPLYNKFRAVSTTLIITQFTVPLLGIITLNQLFTEINKKRFFYALKWTLGILGGITLLYVLAPGIAGSFTGPGDARYADNQAFLDALMIDRKSILRSDALRSLFFIVSGAGVLWLAYRKKLNVKYTGIAIGVLVILDLAVVDKRFISFDDFKTIRSSKSSFTPTNADMSIYTMEAQNSEVKKNIDNFLTTYKNSPVIVNHESPDLLALNLTTDFRVLNLSGGINFSDALTSYYHKSLSGYSPAKLRRYQDLIDRGVLVQQIQNFAKDFQAGENSDSYSLLNMLNTKYFIFDPQQPAFENSAALGNAWFVNSVKWVNSADEEFDNITKIKPREEAIVHVEFKERVPGNITFDSTATINLTSYKPHESTYESKTKSSTLAIFSEMYYPKGWNAYIDGEQTEYLRANYLFRAVTVPAGNHTIVFRFEPRSYLLGNKITIIASIILLIFILTSIFDLIRKNKHKIVEPN